MTGSPDEVVSLLAEGGHVMTDGQIAQSQQRGDRDVIRAGQAGLALPAEIGSDPLTTMFSQLLQAGLFLGCEGCATGLKGSGEGEI